MRETSMTIRLCVLVLFFTSVCQGAAAPVRLDCFTERNSDCIECICKAESTLQKCSTEPCTENKSQDRRKRQSNAVIAATSIEPVAPTSTSTTTTTEAQLQAEVNLSSTSASASASPIIPSLPPPPHPSTTQATAVKLRSCKSGSTWEEECNTCWCLDNGMAACTVKRCEIVLGAKTTKSVSPSDTTPAPPAEQTSTSTSVQSTPEDSRSQTAVLSETVVMQDMSTAVPTTTSVLSSTSLPASSLSSSGGTS